jgi:hypothetical protein
MADETEATQAAQNLQYERVDNFISTYANNAFFEGSAWDLKIIFGQLDQSEDKTVIKQNVAVTVPWAQAKLALYYLRLQVEAMEIQSGKIVIRSDLVPPEPPPLTPEQEKMPGSQEIRELVLRLREEFLASL